MPRTDYLPLPHHAAYPAGRVAGGGSLGGVGTHGLHGATDLPAAAIANARGLGYSFR